MAQFNLPPDSQYFSDSNINHSGSPSIAATAPGGAHNPTSKSPAWAPGENATSYQAGTAASLNSFSKGQIAGGITRAGLTVAGAGGFVAAGDFASSQLKKVSQSKVWDRFVDYGPLGAAYSYFFE